MKILFILTYYYPHWTGLTKYAQRLAEGLAGKGENVTVLTTKHEKDLEDEERTGGVRVVRKTVLFRLSRTLVSLDLILSFWRYIREADRVVVYLPFSEVLIVALVSKILGKKLFLVHNGDLKLPKGFVNDVIEKVYYAMTDVAMSLCEGIFIQTEDNGNSSNLLSKYKKKWRVILPLFDREDGGNKSFDSAQGKGSWGNRWRERIGETKNIVGFAGRFVEEKGFDVLLEAIPNVLEKSPSAKFVFAGETSINYENFFEKNSELIERNRKYLVLLGRLNDSQMSEFYRVLTLLVISSRSDCYPSVGVEAMLSGVPLVVTDIPGVRMQVKDTGMGVVVAPENPQLLAEGIIEVFGNRDKYVRNRVKVKRIYDYEKTIREYQKVLR